MRRVAATVLFYLLVGFGVAQDAPDYVPADVYEFNTAVVLPDGTLQIAAGWCSLYASRFGVDGMDACYAVQDADAIEFQAAFLASFLAAGYVIERQSRIAEHQTAWVLTHPDWAHELTVVSSVFPEQRTTSVAVILRPRL